MSKRTDADGPEKQAGSLLKKIQVALYSGISGFVASLLVELTGNQANNTPFGQTVGHVVLLVAAVVVPLALGLLVFLALRGRRSEERRPAIEEERPPQRPTAPEVWTPPKLLYGREREVADAVSRVLETGVAAIVGARDVGTSTVAAAVVQELIDEHGGDPVYTYRFDLRSRSTKAPYDAIATAGRVVSAFDIDEPSDDTGDVLARAANLLIDEVARQGGILLLDNVSTSEQVWWLVREWPSGGWPRLVIAGDPPVGEAIERYRVDVGELDDAHLRELWDRELDVPEPGLRQRIMAKLGRSRHDEADPVGELLRACLGRPSAVIAFTDEIRSDRNVTAENLAAAIRAGGPAEGPLERVWTAILDNIRDWLSADAAWLLEALAELPVTGLTRGAVAAVLRSDDLTPLEELRTRNLVREQAGGRFRLPAEIRRPILATRPEGKGHAVALRAVPALVGYLAEHVEQWAVRLEKDVKEARAWFRNSEPTLRPLFGADFHLDDDVLALVLDDLSAIADALDMWYVREQQSRGLLEVSEGLYALVNRAQRDDLAALAAIRMATAHRLAGRLGRAAEPLAIAREHLAAVADERIMYELDIRVRVEVALLALTRGDPGVDALDEAIDGLEKHRDAGVPEVLLDLGALYLARQRPAEATAHLKKAERLAAAARDVGCEAHAVELQGIALSEQDGQLIEAARFWQRAQAMFERTGEDRGMARCLQHLGSAALADPRVAGHLRDGRPVPLAPHDAAAVAVEWLERAKDLRTGQPDTELADHYLGEARRRLVTVSIYLSDDGGHEQVEAAVIDLLEQAGSQVVRRDPPVPGSWFRRLFASRTAKEVGEVAAHALDSRLVLSQDAQRTAKMLENLGPLVASLQTTKKAVICVGALLIVKFDDQLSVHQLTASQQLRLNHQPRLLRSPTNILTELEAAHQQHELDQSRQLDEATPPDPPEPGTS